MLYRRYHLCPSVALLYFGGSSMRAHASLRAPAFLGWGEDRVALRKAPPSQTRKAEAGKTRRERIRAGAGAKTLPRPYCPVTRSRAQSP